MSRKSKNYGIKKNLSLSDKERFLYDGKFMDDEIDLSKAIANNVRNGIYLFYQRSILLFTYDFLKTYLYRLHKKFLYDEKINIVDFFGIGSTSNPIAIVPQISGMTDEGHANVENDIVIASIKYLGSSYQVSVYSIINNQGYRTSINYYIAVLGTESGSFRTKDLLEHLINQSINHSVYKNKIIKLIFDNDERIDIKLVSRKEFETETMDKIFIPEVSKFELLKFKNCVCNFNLLGMGLRYLLCGIPGTAKTKTVRTLINMCYGNATIMLLEGEINFKCVFDFAKILTPSIICLDDLDLLIGHRSMHLGDVRLSYFLQELDGFCKSSIFLLCTTNDRELIDKAASRPGRFDLIIDFGKISKSNYSDIINSNCRNEKIISLFDDQLLEDLKKKKVTGAFIVNLIKQLEILNTLEPGYDLRDYINIFIKISYKGFCQSYKEEEETIKLGFSDNGE